MKCWFWRFLLKLDDSGITSWKKTEKHMLFYRSTQLDSSTNSLSSLNRQVLPKHLPDTSHSCVRNTEPVIGSPCPQGNQSDYTSWHSPDLCLLSRSAFIPDKNWEIFWPLRGSWNDYDVPNPWQLPSESLVPSQQEGKTLTSALNKGAYVPKLKRLRKLRLNNNHLLYYMSIFPLPLTQRKKCSQALKNLLKKGL